MIGSPPNVSVPTHFAKVVLTSSQPAPGVFEVSTGAFVLPNAIIPDEASLESFVVPGSFHPHVHFLTLIRRLFFVTKSR